MIVLIILAYLGIGTFAASRKYSEGIEVAAFFFWPLASPLILWDWVQDRRGRVTLACPVCKWLHVSVNQRAFDKILEIAREHMRGGKIAVRCRRCNAILSHELMRHPNARKSVYWNVNREAVEAHNEGVRALIQVNKEDK